MDLLLRALEALDVPSSTPSRHDSTQGSPLLDILLPRKEFHLVLDFLAFPDIGTLQLVGAQSQLVHLQDVCKSETIRLAEELISAAMWNNLPKMQQLLDRQVPPTVVAGSLWKGFTTPLSAAAMRGNFDACEVLLQAGAHVNWSDERGITALEMAQTRLRYQSELSPLDEGASLSKTIQILNRYGGRVLAQDSDSE